MSNEVLIDTLSILCFVYGVVGFLLGGAWQRFNTPFRRRFPDMDCPDTESDADYFRIIGEAPRCLGEDWQYDCEYYDDGICLLPEQRHHCIPEARRTIAKGDGRRQ